MPVKVMIDVVGDKAASRAKGEKTTARELSLALAHIKLREKELLEEFEKLNMTVKDSSKNSKKK